MCSRRWFQVAVVAGLLSFAPSGASAQSVGPYVPALDGEKRRPEPPPRLAQIGVIEVPLVLRPATEAAPEQLEAMEARNRAGREPLQVGFPRPLPDVVE